MHFDAFISYSHVGGDEFPVAFERSLERLGKRWYRRRALRTFRDASSLGATPDLWPSIEVALESSSWFILLASPAAAASEWVDRELKFWLSKDPEAERVIIVLIDGDLHWNGGIGQFNQASSTALPPRLLDLITSEPKWVDLSWVSVSGDHVLDPSHSRFRSAVADVAAPIHGVPKDDLEGEDIRQQRRAVRYRQAAIAALTTLVIAVGGLAVVSIITAIDRDRALTDLEDANGTLSELNVEIDRAQSDLQRTQREAGALEAAALSIAADDPWQAILLALRAEAATDESLFEARRARALATRRFGQMTFELRESSETLFQPDRLRRFSLSPNGHLLAWIDSNERVRIADTDTGLESVAGENGVDRLQGLAWSPQSDRLLLYGSMGDDTHVLRVLVVSADGRVDATTSVAATDQINGAVWAPNGTMIATSHPTGIIVWDLDDSGSLVENHGPFRPDGQPVQSHVGDPSWPEMGAIGARFDLTLHIFDSLDGSEIGRIDGLLSSGTSTALNASVDLFAAELELQLGRVGVYDVHGSGVVGFIEGGTTVQSFSWNDDGTQLAIVYFDGIEVWSANPSSLSTLTPERLRLPGTRPLTVTWTTPTTLRVVYDDGIIRTWTVPDRSIDGQPDSSLVWVDPEGEISAHWSSAERTFSISEISPNSNFAELVTFDFPEESLPSVVGPLVGSELFVVVSDQSSRERIFAIATDGTSDGRLVLDIRGRIKAVDPQGRFAFVDDGNLAIVAVSGAQIVGLPTNIEAAIWSSDGETLAISSSDMVTLYELQEEATFAFISQFRLTRSDDSESGALDVESGAFSPDGSRLALVTESGNDDRLIVLVINGTTADEVWRLELPKFSERGFAGLQVGWLPDGATLTLSDRLSNLLIDADDGHQTTEIAMADEAVNRRLTGLDFFMAGDSALVAFASMLNERTLTNQVPLLGPTAMCSIVASALDSLLVDELLGPDLSSCTDLAHLDGPAYPLAVVVGLGGGLDLPDVRSSSG